MSVRRIGIFSQLVPPKADWTEEKVPDQEGKTVIITGGNIGIGKETARVLLSKGAKVYIATRSADKAEVAIDELKAVTGKDSVFFLQLNLADLDSVKTAAEEFMRKEPELHTLYNNRGVTYAKADQTTRQGYDTIFGTNVLGHFYFTRLLLPVLKAAVKGSPAGTVRVVNMSSIAHYMAASEGIRWSTLGPEEDAAIARKKLGVARLFGQSKLGNILFSNEFARRYKEDGIVSISHFPGAVNADVAGYADSFWKRSIGLLGACCCLILSGGNLETITEDLRREEQRAMRDIRAGAESTAKAAERQIRQNSGFSDDLDPDETREPARIYHRAITSLYAGTDPAGSQLNGRYLTAWPRVTLPSRKALNSRLAAALWDWCEERIKEHTKIADEDVKIREDSEVEVDSKRKDSEHAKVEEVTKVLEITKTEEDTKPKEDVKVEKGTDADEATKAKDDTEAKEDTKSKDDTGAKEDTN